MDVYGNEIPGIPGRDLKIVLGTGTELDENNPRVENAGLAQLIRDSLWARRILAIDRSLGGDTNRLDLDYLVNVSASTTIPVWDKDKGGIVILN